MLVVMNERKRKNNPQGKGICKQKNEGMLVAIDAQISFPGLEVKWYYYMIPIPLPLCTVSSLSVDDKGELMWYM